MFQPAAPEVKKLAEATIQQLSHDPVAFSIKLSELLDVASPYTEANKIAVSIFLKSFLNNQLASRALQADHRAQVFEKILNLMLPKARVSTPCVSHLSACLENILFFDEADTLGSISSEAMVPVSQGLNSSEPEVIKSSLIMLRAIFNVLTNEKKLSQRFTEVVG